MIIDNIKQLKKEMQIIIDEYDDLSYSLATYNDDVNMRIKVEEKKYKALNKIIKRIERTEKYIESIQDDSLRQIIRLKANGKTFDEIAYIVGYSKSQVKRIIKRAK